MSGVAGDDHLDVVCTLRVHPCVRTATRQRGG
jgi:hypothetical protein